MSCPVSHGTFCSSHREVLQDPSEQTRVPTQVSAGPSNPAEVGRLWARRGGSASDACLGRAAGQACKGRSDPQANGSKASAGRASWPQSLTYSRSR